MPGIVNEVNGAPTAPSLSASANLERGQAAAGDAVATASGSTDPDGDAVTYELDSASAVNYAINPTTGAITLTQAGADIVNAGGTIPAPVVNATDGTLDSAPVTGTVPGIVDTTAPTGLLGAAEIVIDANNDGIIDIEEKGTSNQTDVVIELGAGIEVGDILTLTSNTGQAIAPITITQSMITAGSVTFTGVNLSESNGGTLEVEASLSDSAGNVSTDTAASDEATLNTYFSIAPVAQSKTVAMYEDGKGFTGNDPTAANAINGDNANLNRPSVTIDIAKVQQRDTKAFDIYIQENGGTFVPLQANQYSVSVNTDGSYTYQTLNARENGTYNLVATLKGQSPTNSIVANEVTTVEVGYKFTVADFGFTDANFDSLAAIIISGLPNPLTTGKLLLNGVAVTENQPILAADIGSLLFVPKADYSGKPTFGFKVQDAGDISGGGANISENVGTITIDVVAVADGPVIEYEYIPPSTTAVIAGLIGSGVNMAIQEPSLNLNDNTSITTNFKTPSRVDYISGVMDTNTKTVPTKQVVESLTSPSVETLNKQARRYDGLIYLEAGTYKFNGTGIDETVVLNVGNQRVLQNNQWNDSLGYKSTDLTVTEAGFYTLDMYFMNDSGPGGVPNLTIAGGKFITPTQLTNGQINGQGVVKLFTSVDSINEKLLPTGLELSGLKGSTDGFNGHYVIAPAINQGESNSWIKLSDLTSKALKVDLLDKNDDSSESLNSNIYLSGLPVGAKLLHRNNSGTVVEEKAVETVNDLIDITTWNRDKIEVFVPPQFSGNKLPISIIASSTDKNGDIQQAETTLIVKIVNEKSMINETIYGGSGPDTLDGGIGNDILIGGSAGDIRGGGFEYWDFSATLWQQSGTANYDSISMGARSLNGKQLLNMGAWNIAGKTDYATGTTNTKFNNLQLLKPTYTSTEAGAWVLDTKSAANDNLDIWQKVLTVPGEVYELSFLVSTATAASNITILWDGANIARIPNGEMTGTALATNNGFSGSITVGNGVGNGIPTNMALVKINVKGDMDASFTELRLQSDSVGTGVNGRIIAEVNLKAAAADGNDTLIGGYGNDLIYGQAGNDILYGDVKPENGGAVNGSIGNDVFAFSMLKDNGIDIIKDFSIANDKLYMIDVLDAYQGSGTYGLGPDGAHRTRYPGTEGDNNAQSTSKSDDNITIKDLISGAGNNSQYITVSGSTDGANNLVLSLTGRGSSKGSVTLEGIKYGMNDGKADTYGSVADLLGANGHKQILYVTTDSFNTGVDNDFTTLTNIMNTPYNII